MRWAPAAIKNGASSAERALHLDVRDARLLERLAHRRVTQAGVEALGAALRVQAHRAVAACAGHVLQRAQHRLAVAFAAQHAVHGHAADAGHAALARQQAAGGDDLAEPVARDGVRDRAAALIRAGNDASEHMFTKLGFDLTEELVSYQADLATAIAHRPAV